jgi:toxin-antitoxin system PIN domain toxin
VILIDANLLLYAYHTRAAEHTAARAWLETAFGGTAPVGLAWITLWAFLRIATNPRVFERPLSIDAATEITTTWLEQPVVRLLEPGERHWDILRDLTRHGQTIGPLVMDAVLAALAIEHGAVLQTTDRDFARFPGLSWADPLQA